MAEVRLKKRKNFPYVPPHINSAYLHSNGKLLDDETIECLQKKLKNWKPSRISKNSKMILGTTLPYGVIVDLDGIYVIYREDKETKLANDGSFGAVKLAQNIATGEWKVLKTQKLNDDISKDIFHAEYKTLHALHKTQSAIIRHSNKHQYSKGNFLMPYEQGIVLSDFICKPHNAWPDLMRLEIAILIAQAIKNIHDGGRLHCDIKPHNIILNLFSDPPSVSLIDYGLALPCKQDKSVVLDEKRGTDPYMGAEFDANQESYTYNEASEVYALGIVLQHILCQQQVTRKDATGKKSIFPYGQPPMFRGSLPIQQLLADMQQDAPDQRPSMSQIIEQLTLYRAAHVNNYAKQAGEMREVLRQMRAEEAQRLEQIYTALDVKQQKENEEKQASESNSNSNTHAISGLFPLPLSSNTAVEKEHPFTQEEHKEDVSPSDRVAGLGKR